MTYLKLKFTHYSLCYYANDKERKPGDCIIKISCYSDDKRAKRKHDGTALTIKFFKDDSEIPPNECRKYGSNWVEKYGWVDKINLHYPISQFSDIISILRHEKPLCLFIEEEKDNPKGGVLTEGIVDDNIYIDVPIKFFKY